MLSGVLQELDPEGIPMPLLQGGVTDGRFFSQLGIQTYGFMPMRLPGEFPVLEVVHAADERVPAAAIEFGTEAVSRALQRF
jgi:acetylornithine deacetylase/succinyl-diaminopimelate desuccinylase-like protein